MTAQAPCAKFQNAMSKEKTKPKEEAKAKEPKLVTLTEQASLEELQKVVGGFVEVVTLADGRQLVCNEDGQSKGLPLNIEASSLMNKVGPWAHPILGDCAVLEGKAVLKPSQEPDEEEGE